MGRALSGGQVTLSPNTRIAGPHPERWTARVVVVVGDEVLLVWEGGPPWFSVVARGVVERGWVVR